MELAHRWHDRNLTRLELVSAIFILSLLIGIFSRYMFIVFGKVEKSMMDRTLININTALNVQSAFALLKNDKSYFDNVVNMNPMDLMTSQPFMEDLILNEQKKNVLINNAAIAPSNYGGEVINDSDPGLDSGLWYFDKDDGLLFYKINNNEFFTSDIDGPARIRYKVRLNYTDQDNDHSFTPSVDKFLSIKLQAIDNFEWSF